MVTARAGGKLEVCHVVCVYVKQRIGFGSCHKKRFCGAGVCWSVVEKLKITSPRKVSGVVLLLLSKDNDLVMGGGGGG